MSTWWRHPTLRLRLVFWYAGGGTLLLAAYSLILYAFVALRMAQPLDHQLRQQLGEVTRRLAVTADRQLLWDGKAMPTDPGWTPINRWFELWDDHGRLVRRCWPFKDADLDFLPVAPASRRETISIFYVDPDIRLRTLSAPYAGTGHPEGWMLRVMVIHEPVADALGALSWIMVLALPVVIAVLVLGGYLLIRRWLGPLDRMVAAAAQISAADLSPRLPVASEHDELGRLGAAFNVTLDRLEAAFNALDRFVADASHELRTPLTTLRSVGEVGLKRARSPGEYREIIASMLEEAQRLEVLTHRLLELAVAEGGAQSLRRELVRVDERVAQWVGELAILAEDKEQTLVLNTVPCSLVTDPVLIRQALQNLLGNAIKYSPVQTSIQVDLIDAGPSWVLSVSDEGPGIPEEHRSFVTERFYRADSSQGSAKGFGLGLALTKAYVRALGGELSYLPRRPRGSTFQIVLPKG